MQGPYLKEGTVRSHANIGKLKPTSVIVRVQTDNDLFSFGDFATEVFDLCTDEKGSLSEDVDLT